MMDLSTMLPGVHRLLDSPSSVREDWFIETGVEP